MTIKLQAAKRLIVTAADGYVSGPVELVFAKREPMQFKSSSAFDKWSYSKACRALGDTSHMRIGHFSIILFKDKDVGVCKEYAELHFSGDTKWKGVYPPMKNDRLSQMKNTEAALKHAEHPLLGAVMKDITAERAEWAKVSDEQVREESDRVKREVSERLKKEDR